MDVMGRVAAYQMQQMEQDVVRKKMMDILLEHDIELEDISMNDYTSFKDAGVNRVRKNKYAALKELDYMTAGNYICLKAETDNEGTVVVYLASATEVLALEEDELYLTLDEMLIM